MIANDGKKGRGRPPLEVEKIPATAEEIARALFRDADDGKNDESED